MRSSFSHSGEVSIAGEHTARDGGKLLHLIHISLNSIPLPPPPPSTSIPYTAPPFHPFHPLSLYFLPRSTFCLLEILDQRLVFTSGKETPLYLTAQHPKHTPRPRDHCGTVQSPTGHEINLLIFSRLSIARLLPTAHVSELFHCPNSAPQLRTHHPRPAVYTRTRDGVSLLHGVVRIRLGPDPISDSGRTKPNQLSA